MFIGKEAMNIYQEGMFTKEVLGNKYLITVLTVPSDVRRGACGGQKRPD